MPTIIDRYMLRQFVQVLVICFLSLIGLYIVIDAFGHLDHFVDYCRKARQPARHAGRLLRVPGNRVFRPHQRRADAHRGHVHRHLDSAAQ